ncbi:response regulator, partial [bacterium]|nr:response regulator [bacterium]
MARERRILLVDDNQQYRSAVIRNLSLADYNVIEAEDATEGMQKLQTENPQVVITDLDMRTHDEGLRFIQDAKRQYPSLPIIMISAVGTFDEGALAKQYGAMFVLSKSRIDAEIETLYKGLDRIYDQFETIDRLRAQMDAVLQEGKQDEAALREEINALLHDQNIDDGLKSDVYEMLDKLDQRKKPSSSFLDDEERQRLLESMRGEIPNIHLLDKETLNMLCVAESMQRSDSAVSLSVARNISFSYSFAVENEVKLRMGKKIAKLFSGKPEKIIEPFYDTQLNNLDIFFNQYLIRTTQNEKLELNSDIARQVMERVRVHGNKYKPDGLKALGIIIFCWGRHHEFTNRKSKVKVTNPLGLKNVTNEEASQLASDLVLLQHLRNPY